jgi:hypothetical protein
VEAEVGVGAEEGVGEGNGGRLGHLSEQVVGIEGAAAGAVRTKEETKTVVVVTGREEERVKLGRDGGREQGRGVLGAEEDEALPDKRAGCHPEFQGHRMPRSDGLYFGRGLGVGGVIWRRNWTRTENSGRSSCVGWLVRSKCERF